MKMRINSCLRNSGIFVFFSKCFSMKSYKKKRKQHDTQHTLNQLQSTWVSKVRQRKQLVGWIKLWCPTNDAQLDLVIGSYHMSSGRPSTQQPDWTSKTSKSKEEDTIPSGWKLRRENELLGVDSTLEPFAMKLKTLLELCEQLKGTWRWRFVSAMILTPDFISVLC